jgi:cytochrome c2
MKKSKLRNFLRMFFLNLIFNFLSLIFLTLPSNAGDAAVGEDLFKKKCKQCHKTTEQVLIGPGLKDVIKRRDVEWIDRWLSNPKKMLESDPIAQELKKKFKRAMPKIPEMSNEEHRKNIIEYLKTL